MSYTPSNIKFSLEVFPPKTEGALEALWKNMEDLATLDPYFISVTYGAGGTTKDRTGEIATEMAKRTNINVGTHLTCVGAPKSEIDSIADYYWKKGIKHIVALRGDPPNMEGKYEPHPDGYDYALDLMEGLKKQHDFEISTAAYPEGHPEAPSEDFDLDYLRKKMDAGADRAITQFFFDPEVYFRFRDKAVAKGIDESKLVPGLLPIINFERMVSFAKRCGASVPGFLYPMFEGTNHQDMDHKLLAMNILSHQITRLIEGGVTTFHFYTLNEYLLTGHLCRWLRAGF